jgi:hypothetical protein
MTWSNQHPKRREVMEGRANVEGAESERNLLSASVFINFV